MTDAKAQEIIEGQRKIDFETTRLFREHNERIRMSNKQEKSEQNKGMKSSSKPQKKQSYF